MNRSVEANRDNHLKMATVRKHKREVGLVVCSDDNLKRENDRP